MNSKTSLFAVALTLVGLLAVSVPAAAAGSAPVTVDEVTYDGSGTAPMSGYGGGETYLWKSNAVAINANLSASEDVPYKVCAYIDDGEGGAKKTLDCQSGKTKANKTVTVTLSASSLPDSPTVRRNLSIVVVNTLNNTELTTHTEAVHVIRKTGDVDNDGLSNRRELELETNFTNVDSDRDGINDGPEVKNYQTSPLEPDTDFDGLRDREEVSMGTEPTNPDTDGDGLDDGRERKLGTDPLNAAGDVDGDGLSDAREIELGTDLTDPAGDADGDGLVDAKEVALGTNPSVTDSDSDMISDATEHRFGTDPTDGTTPYKLTGVALTAFGAALIWRRRTERTGLADVVRRYRDASSSSSHSSSGASDDRDETVPVPIPKPAQPMTDEDRVFEILSEHDGQVKQSRIIEETDWSKSKVSRLLSRLDEEDKITKISVGRENLITPAGEEPSAVRSPFEK
jgi:hypothetical protein